MLNTYSTSDRTARLYSVSSESSHHTLLGYCSYSVLPVRLKNKIADKMLKSGDDVGQLAPEPTSSLKTTSGLCSHLWTDFYCNNALEFGSGLTYEGRKWK